MSNFFKSPEAFMDRYGITGHLSYINGPRINIERARFVWNAKNRAGISQRAYIDLATYTAHCFTYGLGPWHCKQESWEVIRALEPLARAARKEGITSEGEPVPVTQGRVLYRHLHEAGVGAVLHRTELLLDMDILVRAANVPWLPSKEGFDVFLRPKDPRGAFGREWAEEQELLDHLGGVTSGMVLGVRPLKGKKDPLTEQRLLEAADHLLRQVFGSKWTPQAPERSEALTAATL